jgi:hypothetical protein
MRVRRGSSRCGRAGSSGACGSLPGGCPRATAAPAVAPGASVGVGSCVAGRRAMGRWGAGRPFYLSESGFVVNVLVDVLVGFDSVVVVVIVAAGVVGYRVAKPHVDEFKAFSKMFGGKR